MTKTPTKRPRNKTGGVNLPANASAFARKAVARSPMAGQGTRTSRTGRRTGGGY